MSSHTPGPWLVSPLVCYVTNSESTFAVAEICSQGYADSEREERRANAHLIAAAPDLLDACRAAYTAHTPCWQGDNWGDCPICTILRAAIDKAVGGE